MLGRLGLGVALGLGSGLGRLLVRGAQLQLQRAPLLAQRTQATLERALALHRLVGVGLELGLGLGIGVGLGLGLALVRVARQS